VAELKLVW
jgi:hypothetical protein